MRVFLIPALIVATTAAVPVFASERCDAPQSEWRTVDELKTELTAKGWTINNVKTEDGCYEVYGHDEAGKRVEIFFDPVTFEAVGSDD
ncbi:PepSY domain-containing protein [Paracoccus sp. TK19116]|uniref:PepSY domain-containing protein n=1 Tax=Paracoccus albicereus TaxID=2922394 RepID=A0ABT1MUX9_9RHOB|nr:PepSY domain-containing protein [Paracoccus albicereus]MCQ0972011.1 PepSY domain-containing protein [Paracoccus albicereus]